MSNIQYSPLNSMPTIGTDKLGRRAWLIVTYTDKGEIEAKDISEELSKYLLSCSYTDNMGGQADDLTITLEDRAGLWFADWFPSTGAMLNVTIHVYNWNSLMEGEKVLELGKFQIDEIEVQGSPSTVQIKATTILQDTPLQGVKKNRTWENISIWKCADDICQENGLTLFWDCDENPNLDHVEQSDESDLAFLQKVCKDAGFSLKADIEQLIIFDEKKYEAKDATLTFSRPGTTFAGDGTTQVINLFSGWSMRAKTRDIYYKCHVKHSKGKGKEVIEAEFTAPDKTTGQVLEVSEQVDNVEEAERLAKKKLREKNAEEIAASFSTAGNISLVAGIVINLVNFGKFDGKYIITKASHDIGGSYTTSIDIRRCLNGY